MIIIIHFVCSAGFKLRIIRPVLSITRLLVCDKMFAIYLAYSIFRILKYDGLVIAADPTSSIERA